MLGHSSEQDSYHYRNHCITQHGTRMTYQEQFGGAWTQQKLAVLTKYLQAYTKIFERNPRAQFYSTTYVDAFAGTGVIRRPGLGEFARLFPSVVEAEQEFRKGSARRALELNPAFDRYVFIERNMTKCKELKALAADFPEKGVKIINDDANRALLEWCDKLDSKKERAVVFLDPFGASVEWRVIAALGRIHAVDLWILFPYFAVNRMLVRHGKPPTGWAERLTKIFGTTEWEKSFYSRSTYQSLLNPSEQVEHIYKSVDHREIIDFFIDRLSQEFKAVSRPLPLHNSKGALLFLLVFAAGNERSATTGIKIANSIVV